jgi:HAMP domain-containing protein
MADRDPQKTGPSTGDLLTKALLHPLSFVGLAVGLVFLPMLRQGAFFVSLLLYLGVAGVLMFSWGREPRQPRGTRRIPSDLRGRARELAEGVVALEGDIRRMMRTGGAEVRNSLAPVVDEVSDLAGRAIRLAQSYQRALEHRDKADVAGIEEERDSLIRQRDEAEDGVVRRQLDEAIASVERRLADMDDLERAASRCEAAIFNIQTTLQGLQTRVLKFATSERGASGRERQELAQEIDTVRATSAALEDLIEGEELLEA